MPNIVNADDGQISGSAGLKINSDSDGTLVIQNNGVDAVSVDSSNIVTFATPPRLSVTNIPFLIASSSGTSSPAYNTWSERTINYTTPEGIGSGTFSGGRYTPNVPGLYQVNVTAQTGANTTSVFGAAIFLNGTLYRSAYSRLNTAINTNAQTAVAHTILLNGTTDFVGAGYYIGGTTGVTSINIQFSVCLLQRTE